MSKNPGKGYDRIAPIYDAMACIASFNQINKSQLAFLAHLSNQATCLILGGGTGYFLQKLVETNKTIHVTYVEASEKMIALTQKRIKKKNPDALHRITFICKRVEDFEFDKYDVIVCNYFLDLFDDTVVETFATKFKQKLNQGGVLYVTDFTFQNDNHFIQRCTKIGLKVLYSFFRWTTSISVNKLPQIEKNIMTQNFTLLYSKKHLRGILTCWLYKIDGCS